MNITPLLLVVVFPLVFVIQFLFLKIGLVSPLLLSTFIVIICFDDMIYVSLTRDNNEYSLYLNGVKMLSHVAYLAPNITHPLMFGSGNSFYY